MKKRLLAAVLIAMLAMAMAFLSGCGSDNGTDGGRDAGAAANGNFNTAGFPIVDEPVTLNVIMERWDLFGDSFLVNPWFDELEERTNVIIDWTLVSGGDWHEQRTLMMISGDLPDLFLGQGSVNDAMVMTNPQHFIDLTDLVENYMPNYRRALELMPAMRQLTTYPTGGKYSLAFMLPGRPMPLYQPVINMHWLDVVGLAPPTNTDELLTVLRAFRDNDVNQNGDPNDEFPVTWGADVPRDWFTMFGIVDHRNTLFNMTGDTPEFWPMSENYRVAIRFLRGMWEEGLIDPMAFTQDWGTSDGKIGNYEIPLVGLHFAWAPNGRTGRWYDQHEPIPPIASEFGRFADGDPNGINALGRNAAHITSVNPMPEVTARWLDEFYTNEATITNFWGAFGVVLYPNADGTFSHMSPPPGQSADLWFWEQSMRDVGPGFADPAWIADHILFDYTQGDGRKLMDSRMADPYVTIPPFPMVLFTTAESEEVAIMGAEIRTFIQQNRANWIVNGGIDEEWDAYLATLEQLGVPRFIEIHLAALERFRAAQ